MVRDKYISVKMAVIFAVMSSTALASQDPTAPLGGQQRVTISAPSAESSLPELQAIVCHQVCYAVFGEHVVTVGDVVSGYRVSEVTQEQVTLNKGRQEWPLQLFSLAITE